MKESILIEMFGEAKKSSLWKVWHCITLFQNYKQVECKYIKIVPLHPNKKIRNADESFENINFVRLLKILTFAYHTLLSNGMEKQWKP